MADHHDAEPVVEVDVLVAVHVPDTAAFASLHENGLRRCVLKRGWDPARHDLTSFGPELLGARAGAPELLFLARYELGDAAGRYLASRLGRHSLAPLLSPSP
jgi:hypothetical protein